MSALTYFYGNYESTIEKYSKPMKEMPSFENNDCILINEIMFA